MIADQQAVANWQFANANRGRNKPPPEKPKPIPRPTDTAKKQSRRTQLSDREITRRLVDLQRRAKKR